MIKVEMIIDNKIASTLSPKEFVMSYVINKNPEIYEIKELEVEQNEGVKMSKGKITNEMIRDLSCSICKDKEYCLGVSDFADCKEGIKHKGYEIES